MRYKNNLYEGKTYECKIKAIEHMFVGSDAVRGAVQHLDGVAPGSCDGCDCRTEYYYSASVCPQRPVPILHPDTSTRDTTVQPTTASTHQPAKSFTSTATQVEPSTADAATAARPLPPPLLSAPSISTLELARRVEQSFHSHPLAPTDAILSNVQRSFIDTTPASETCSTNLAIDFGAELLRLTADRVLRELQARFADLTHLDHNMTTAILRYIFEELDIWRRRPERSSSSVPYNLI